MNNAEKDSFHKVKINNSQTIVSKYTTLNEEDRIVDHEEIKIQFLNCVKRIAKIGIPSSLFFLCLFLQQAICLAFIGKKHSNHDMIPT